MDFRADLQFAGGGVHQVRDSPGRGVAAAGMAERGDVQPAAFELIARAGCGLVPDLLLELQFPIRGIGQHVDAQRERGVDLRLDGPGVFLAAPGRDSSQRHESAGRGFCGGSGGT